MNPAVSTTSFQTVPTAPAQHEPAAGRFRLLNTSVHDQDDVGKTFGKHARKLAPQGRTQRN
ncbi:MAG: hypothetical protein WA446_01435 [Steroidobacteraceae bacterium]